MHLAVGKGAQRDDGRPFTGWMALATFAAFFGAIFCANAALVYFALSTFSGEQEASPYEHGLAYDKDLAAARVQDARGWRVTVRMERPAPGAPALIDVVINGPDNRPLEGLSVSAALAFPTDKKRDKSAPLIEASPGDYSAQAALQDGLWDVEVTAARDGERQFRSHNRITLH